MKETAFNLHRPLRKEGFQNRTLSHKETLWSVVHSACGNARVNITHVTVAESKVFKGCTGLMVSMGCDM
jgi:hypothetical protein